MLYTPLYMASLRTQIYLTREQRQRLDMIARREGKSLAELIRAAVDEFLTGAVPEGAKALDDSFGSAPGFEVPSRDEWDRG